MSLEWNEEELLARQQVFVETEIKQVSACHTPIPAYFGKCAPLLACVTYLQSLSPPDWFLQPMRGEGDKSMTSPSTSAQDI
jgi:hypothetical protein